MLEFNVRVYAKELDKHLKIQGYTSDLQDKVKELVTYEWGVFCGK